MTAPDALAGIQRLHEADVAQALLSPSKYVGGYHEVGATSYSIRIGACRLPGCPAGFGAGEGK